MRRLFVILFAAAALQACSSPKTAQPTPGDLAAFTSGNVGMLIINTGGGMACDQAVFGIHRDGASKNEVIWTLRDLGYATTQPAILAVYPGLYQVVGASCMKAGYYPSPMGALPYWFGKVEVKSGEVVYMGTLDTEVLKYKAEMSGGAKALNAILFTGRDANEYQYLSYQFKDQNGEVLERLRVSHPDLAAKMVTRTPPVYITKENFAAALGRAFAANPDGSLPKPDVAEARLPEELKKIAEEAIKRRNGQQ
jgi:hypothetical protein